jgi:hypothetical protein
VENGREGFATLDDGGLFLVQLFDLSAHLPSYL